VQTLGKIPVVQGLKKGGMHVGQLTYRGAHESTYDKRRHTSLEQGVDEVGIEFDARLVHGVIATAEGDDPRPGEGETVALDAIMCQKVEVLSPAVVRVGGDIAVAAIECLAWYSRVIVPDGLATTVGIC
jgi:hypothetical protein